MSQSRSDLIGVAFLCWGDCWHCGLIGLENLYMADSQESLHFLDYWRVISARKEVIIIIAIIISIAGIVVTYSMPRVYMASAVIQVKQESPDVDPFREEGYSRYDPLYLRTQYEIIQSTPIIEEVARNLNLNEKLGRSYGYLEQLGPKSFDQTVKIISKNMKVQQYRDTNLIEIKIFMKEPKDSAPELAASVANEVVNVYMKESYRTTRDQVSTALKKLKQQIEEKKTEVSGLEDKLSSIRTDKGIVNLASMYGTDGSIEKKSLAILEEFRIRAKLKYQEKKAKYDTLKNLSTNELLGTVRVMVNDPVLATIFTEKSKAEVVLSQMEKESLGPRHPDVIKLKAQIGEFQVKLDEILSGLVMGVKKDFESAQAEYENIEKEMAVLKQGDALSESSGYLDYEKASDSLKRARKFRDILDAKYIEESIKLDIPRSSISIKVWAKAPDVDDPYSPDFPLNITLSILIGLVMGISMAFFVEYMDTSVKTIEDIEQSMKVSVLGVIPQRVRALNDKGAQQAHAEAYRVLRTNIKFAKNLNGGKVLSVTSGSVGEGKSLTLFNLAYVCAQLGDRVILIDSDLHRPRQHKMVGVDNKKGLANLLIGEISLEDAIKPTNMPNLDFLPSGRLSTGVHGLLNSSMLGDIISLLREQYDWVFFDAPPIIGVSDASIIMRQVDGVCLVVQHRKYPRAISMRAKEVVTNVGANLLGVILNNINVSKDYSYYYYQQHYNYYPSKAGNIGKNSKGAN